MLEKWLLMSIAMFFLFDMIFILSLNADDLFIVTGIALMFISYAFLLPTELKRAIKQRGSK